MSAPGVASSLKRSAEPERLHEPIQALHLANTLNTILPLSSPVP